MHFGISSDDDVGSIDADCTGTSMSDSDLGNRLKMFDNRYLGRWLSFGPVAVKIVRGHLPGGFAYLNIFLKNVRNAGYPVGGLLGQDDHQKEAAPNVGCKKIVNLRADRRDDVTAAIKPG